VDPVFDEARLETIAAAEHLVAVLEDQPERIREVAPAIAEVGATVHALAEAIKWEAWRLVS
jgi:hypothetical protein